MRCTINSIQQIIVEDRRVGRVRRSICESWAAEAMSKAELITSLKTGIYHLAATPSYYALLIYNLNYGKIFNIINNSIN